MKTNRRDAVKLARLCRAGELTEIWTPDEAHEAMCDLVRAREAAVKDRTRKRQEIRSFLLRHGKIYPGKFALVPPGQAPERFPLHHASSVTELGLAQQDPPIIETTGFSPKGRLVRRREDDYMQALKLCTTTAAEEHCHAYATLGRARSLLLDLRNQMHAIEAGSARRHGRATAEAHARLAELAQRLDAKTSDALEATSSALARKKERLSKFTVTLFGRTMAGKSTIREAITRGNGETIGKGAQRTTRDIREYDWNYLRIVDTPGIGAYEGEADRAHASSVIDESDVILFLVSSDGVQESSFRAMRELRDQNKPVIFVLNVRLDLTRRVFLQRFLRSPEFVLGEKAIEGHVARIRGLAADRLGMHQVDIVPIHAQAAFLATRPEHAASADVLHAASGIDRLLQVLTFDVKRRGPVRRVQTILDGTAVQMMDLEVLLREEAKLLDRRARYLKDKFAELDTWLDGYIGGVNDRIEHRASDLLRPLRDSVSSFVDENIERRDVGSRWKKRVEDVGVDSWMSNIQQQLVDDVRARLEEFNREVAVDSELGDAFTAGSPAQYDPWNVKRTLRWTSAAAAALVGVAAIAGWIGSTNFWNPVGWIAGAVSIVALGLSWLFDDREKKLQHQKASAASQLRKQIDVMERRVANKVKEWFYKNITNELVRGIRYETRQLYSGMFGLARTLRASADSCGDELTALNRRLLVKCGAFVGEILADEKIVAIARDPGLCTKFTWNDGETDVAFCREVGKALNESIDGIAPAPRREMIASALTPASVSPEMVHLDHDRASVRLPKREMGRAIGKRGHNVALASRLLRVRIRVVAEETL